MTPTAPLSLALRAVAKPGDVVAVESPAYFGVLQAIEGLGLRALEVPSNPRTGMDVAAFEAIPERKDVRLRIDARQARAGVIRELAQLVKEFRGPAPVLIEMQTSQGPRMLALGPDYRVEPAADFFAEVKALLGPAAVS